MKQRRTDKDIVQPRAMETREKLLKSALELYTEKDITAQLLMRLQSMLDCQRVLLTDILRIKRICFLLQYPMALLR